MKKVIFIGVIIILIGLVGYIFVIKKSVNREPVRPVVQNDAGALPQTPSSTAIDANDNLDQALQDLDQINNL